jgi:uncharacterized protein YceK
MKYSTTGISIQKLLALILTVALSSACAAVDTQGKPGDGEKPRSDATPHLTIDEKLTAELEHKKVKMLVVLDENGKFVVMDTHGVPIEACNDECSGLRDVTVRLIESPVILKTTRNPKCVVWNENGQQKEKCW